MQYVNIKLPVSSLYMFSGNGIQEVINALTGHGGKVIGPDGGQATTGASGIGPWEEGDIEYVYEGRAYGLAYDFIELDDNIGRIFRFANDRLPWYDEQPEQQS